MDVVEATKALKLGHFAIGVNEAGYTIRLWGHNAKIVTITCDGYVMASLRAVDVNSCSFVIRPQTREEMRERLIGAGFGGE